VLVHCVNVTDEHAQYVANACPPVVVYACLPFCRRRRLRRVLGCRGALTVFVPPTRTPLSVLFFLNDPAPTEIYTLSLHDALPISPRGRKSSVASSGRAGRGGACIAATPSCVPSSTAWGYPSSAPARA